MEFVHSQVYHQFSNVPFTLSNLFFTRADGFCSVHVIVTTTVINKPTHVTKTSATAIDHIITNSIFLSSITTGIIKTDITDHMPIFLTSHQKNFDIYPQDTYIYKRYINNNTIEQFKTTIANHDWEYITYIECPNKAYDTFLGNFLNLYEETFPKVKIKLKSKSLLISPWITKGLVKSSKTKHKLYDKFLKNKTYKNETTYKDYKNLFEKYIVAKSHGLGVRHTDFHRNFNLTPEN